MRKSSGGGLAVLCLLAGAVVGCATGGPSAFPGDEQIRPARDLPGRFATREDDITADPPATFDCLNPLFDPRDGGRLELMRSFGGKGDYDVPIGRYGVGLDEFLRVDCLSRRAVGIVPR